MLFILQAEWDICWNNGMQRGHSLQKQNEELTVLVQGASSNSFAGDLGHFFHSFFFSCYIVVK